MAYTICLMGSAQLNKNHDHIDTDNCYVSADVGEHIRAPV
jgi:hypothetical protein